MTSDQDGVAIGVAARLLGISENAVRKRIKRGSLEATKDQAGQWRVVVAGVAGDSRSDSRDQAEGVAGGGSRDQAATSEPIEAQYRLAAVDQTRHNLETIRDEWLQPLVTQIRDLERDRGRLEAENKQLQDRIAALEATESPQGDDNHENEETPADEPGKPWWKFWK